MISSEFLFLSPLEVFVISMHGKYLHGLTPYIAFFFSFLEHKILIQRDMSIKLTYQVPGSSSSSPCSSEGEANKLAGIRTRCPHLPPPHCPCLQM